MHVPRKLNQRLGHALYAVVLVCGSVTAAEDAASPDRPAADASSVSAGDERPQQKGDEDLLDRMFAPLDDAVDDINRSLNEDRTGSPPPSSE